MLYRIMLSLYGLIVASLVMVTQAQAVSLGKIDVASHLGEPFYAEVPLNLDSDEDIASMYVELASPADYRILEVYRDQALNSVRADVLNDSRGSRVELTTQSPIDSPFFNLVLKVRYGRATHYKKYPVFLDLPKATQPTSRKAPMPVISVEEAAVSGPVAMVSPSADVVEEQAATASEEVPASSSAFKPFDGWARTGRYGPMVYGDTISTVADRLRIDNRYTRNQIMVAMFEKNHNKFDQDNINLIKAGTTLDIPLAAEVERIRPDQAREIMRDHNQRWRELMKQPHYAAVAEAQKNRYSKRVRAGKEASGVANAPVSSQAEEPVDGEEPSVSPVVEPIKGGDKSGSPEGVDGGKDAVELTALNESVAKLQQENEALKAKLAESETKISEFAAAPVKEDEKTAAEARVKKLELQLARLQAELDSARQTTVSGEGPDWLMLLGGGFVLLLLGGGVGYLMRRERKHPAMDMAGDSYAGGDLAGEFPMEPEAPEMFSEADAEEIDVEPVKDFGSDFEGEADTETESFDVGFTDSIPDLTDEETGEMEAFKEDIEDEPDPNVDYLSEADVYMRYGMEDEAEKQVQMALKLRENNKDAHIKLVQIRKARGDASGADEAIATARMVLVGDTLSNFESTIANLSTGENSADDVALEDTIPPGTLDVEEDPKAQESIDASDDFGDLADIEFEQEEVPVASAKQSMETMESETMELGNLDFPSEDATIESDTAFESDALPEIGDEPVEAVEAVNEADELDTEAVDEGESTVSYEGDSGLDFDLSGLELPELGAEDESKPDEGFTSDFPELEDAAEPEVEPIVEAASADEGVESMDDDGLNLSDFDLTDESESAKPESAVKELQTADLDKTLVMDWSKDTVSSDEHEIGGESGADDAGISFDLDAADEGDSVEMEPVAEAPAEEAVATGAEATDDIDEPEEHLSSVEFDLDDLNVDLDTPVSSDDVDDFSSTIQTSTTEIEASAVTTGKGDTVDLEKHEVDEDISFDLEPLDEEEPKPTPTPAPKPAAKPADKPKLKKKPEPEPLSHDATVRINVDNMSFDDLMEKSSDKDFDATLELDSLMSELGKDSDSDESDENKE